MFRCSQGIVSFYIAVPGFFHRDGIREMLLNVRLNQVSRSTNQKNKIIPIPTTAGSLTSNEFRQGFSVILRHLLIGFPTSIKSVGITVNKNKVFISNNIGGSTSNVDDSRQSFPGILIEGGTTFKTYKNTVDVVGVRFSIDDDVMSSFQHLFQFILVFLVTIHGYTCYEVNFSSFNTSQIKGGKREQNSFQLSFGFLHRLIIVIRFSLGQLSNEILNTFILHLNVAFNIFGVFPISPRGDI